MRVADGCTVSTSHMGKCTVQMTYTDHADVIMHTGILLHRDVLDTLKGIGCQTQISGIISSIVT